MNRHQIVCESNSHSVHESTLESVYEWTSPSAWLGATINSWIDFTIYTTMSVNSQSVWESTLPPIRIAFKICLWVGFFVFMTRRHRQCTNPHRNLCRNSTPPSIWLDTTVSVWVEITINVWIHTPLSIRIAIAININSYGKAALHFRPTFPKMFFKIFLKWMKNKKPRVMAVLKTTVESITGFRNLLVMVFCV